MDDKLNNLLRFVKPTDLQVLANSFMVLQDNEGWTNGYIADLTGLKKDYFKAVAETKPKYITRFVIEADKAPKISQLLKFESLHEVQDIQLDLKNGYLRLVSEDLTVYVNPVYVSYFAKTYGSIGSISLELQTPTKPVVVKMNGELVGLIMPVYGV